MIVYVAQYYYPDSESDMAGPLIGVASEWNRAIKLIMENHDTVDFYANKVKVNDWTWRIHIDGDLYADIIKCELDAKVPQSE